MKSPTKRNGSPVLSRRKFIRNTGLAAAGLALASCQSGRLFAPKPSRKPHILFLMTDQHRGDCLGCAGNTVIQTPAMDSIAREGVRFSNAFSSTPSCTPARAAVLTGLSPWRHGELGYGQVAQRYAFEFPEALNKNGYYLCAIGKMHWYPQKTLHGFHETWVDESGRVETPGFVSDYRQWFKQMAPDLDPDATGLDWNDHREGIYALPEHLHPTVWTGQTAVRFIENYNRPEPMFLKVSFARPHSPYDPPKRCLDLYETGRMPAPVVGDWAGKYAPHKTPPDPTLWHGDLGVEQAQRSRRAYYGSVTFIDEQIGQILDALKKRDMYQDTLIVLTSDHGDMLGDHHLWRKTYPYQGSAHIPFLLRWPQSMGYRRKWGSTLAQPVELRDLAPTFLDAAGVPVPEGLDGRSLLELVRGRTKDWRPWIDLEHSVCYRDYSSWNALTDGRIKYIYDATTGAEQLFNLEDDPGEKCDLASRDEYQATLETWRERLVQFFAERDERFVKNGKLQIRTKGIVFSPLYPKSETGQKT